LFKCKCGRFSTERRDLADIHVSTAWDKDRHIIEERLDLYSWIIEQSQKAKKEWYLYDKSLTSIASHISDYLIEYSPVETHPR
jgi:hypothetical protein